MEAFATPVAAVRERGEDRACLSRAGASRDSRWVFRGFPLSSGGLMWSLVLLGAGVWCGQSHVPAAPATVPVEIVPTAAQEPGEEPQPIEVPAPFLPPTQPALAAGLFPTGSPPTLPDRWFVMRELQ